MSQLKKNCWTLSLNRPEKIINAGFKYYERAEVARKDDRLEEAIALYDKARFNGYDAPALYDGYAMTYHKLKDYDN